jgi:hypothetical protein
VLVDLVSLLLVPTFTFKVGLLFLSGLFMTLDLLINLGPKLGAEEETTISNESFPVRRTERSNCLDQPESTGATGETSKEKSKDSRCNDVPASTSDALGDDVATGTVSTTSTKGDWG